MTAQVLSTLDYCNVLMLGTTDVNLRPLKLVMNRAVRFICNVPFREHITPYYKKLHFLPVSKRIKFKACSIAYKIFYGSAPDYLVKSFKKFAPTTQICLRKQWVEMILCFLLI